MNNENKNPLDFLVRFVQWVMDVLARAIVAFLDGLNDAVEHSSSPLFGVVATFLPFVLPVPVAFMTAGSAEKFFHWKWWQADTLGIGIEGLGLLVWVWLVESMISDDIQLRNAKKFLAWVAGGYEATLIVLNVVLALNDGAGIVFALGLFLICLLPAMSAAMYGFQRRQTRLNIDAQKAAAAALAEKIRLERRQDRKEAQAMKMQHAADTKGVELEKKPFRGNGKS